MALFRYFNEFLFELKQVTGTANKVGVVFWSNGEIFFDTDIEKIGAEKTWNSIRFKYDTEKKTLACYPFDDWADTKIIRKIQQALEDFINAKFITGNWKVTISNKKLTERSFGSVKAQNIIDFNAHYNVKIPIAFHGTTDKYESEIREKGILPRISTKKPENWEKGYTKKSKKLTYFSTDYDRAKYYAEKAADTVGGKPIVIEVKNIPLDWAEADDDFVNNVSMMQLLLSLNGKKSKTPLVSSIRSSGQFSMNHVIEPSMITKIYKGRQL